MEKIRKEKEMRKKIKNEKIGDSKNVTRRKNEGKKNKKK